MSEPPAPPRVAVVLAAGKGTRMKSELPKVLHRAAGRPLLAWVLDVARAAGCARTLAVIGHRADQVRSAFAAATDVTWIEQREQLGTGHALLQAEPALGQPALALVLSGDVPLVRVETLGRLAAEAEAPGGWGAMAVATLPDPGALGRVIPNAQGDLARIVEARDATAEQRAIRTVNAGIYALPAPAIFQHLHRLQPNNAQGELYLTDAVTAAAQAGHRVALVELEDPDEALGVNDRLELARVHRLLNQRKLRALALAGTTILDPHPTTVGESETIGRGASVHSALSIYGKSVSGDGVTVHTRAWIRDSEIADGAGIEPDSVLVGAPVGPGCRVGPFAPCARAPS